MKNKLIGIGVLVLALGVFILTAEAINNLPSRLEEAVIDWNEQKETVKIDAESLRKSTEKEKKLFCRIGHLKMADDLPFLQESSKERFQNECLNFPTEQ